ncbi:MULTISPECIES: hypothetical protein [unclassified Mycobacterium]|uniref:hypothetical protein n=1 Tax=unclassified Mycobacterium TaxID=2642494 RepID=UPI0029C6810A|nr:MULTISPECIES: hypothetical protein [unclassified Mycobacterium]
MGKRVSLYALVVMFGAAFGAVGMGPRQCGVYGFCTGGYNSTWQMWLLGAGVGALVGVVGTAVIDIVINGRYVLENRQQAKLRRRREEAARRQAPDGNA